MLLHNIPDQLSYFKTGLSTFSGRGLGKYYSRYLIFGILPGMCSEKPRTAVFPYNSACIHYVQCPVLIVPPDTEAIHFDQIVYASQLEFDEKQILLDVIALVNQLKGNLRLVKVNSDDQLNIQPDRQFIDEIENELGIKDITQLTGSHVIDTLEDYCYKIHADLLIVSNRHRGFFAKLLNPSMTKKLTVETNVPLLVYHQKSYENKVKTPMVVLS